MLDQPSLPPLEAKAAAFEHAVVPINVGDQLILDSGPVAAQQVERRNVDRRAVPFDGGGGLHEAAAQQRMRQVDARQHGEQQPLKRQHVAFAVFE